VTLSNDNLQLSQIPTVSVGMLIRRPPAKVFQALVDPAWGDRHRQPLDPFGHRGNISQRLRDVPTTRS
jgi:hypothetical protein